MKRKWLAIGIILLFVGVAIAPTINFNTVKASTDDDLVEVTTQTCGIKGFKDTTVKLTRQQYQNLEQYLNEFQTSLNQTSTKEEAIPLFKDAIVELDKYGLLPKRMNVEQAQRLIIGNYFSQRTEQNLQDKASNYFCLTFGKATHALVNTIPLTIIIKRTDKIDGGSTFLWKLIHWAEGHNLIGLYGALIMINLFIYLSLIACYFFGMLIFAFSPMYIGANIGFGLTTLDHTYSPSNGYIFTLGLNGLKIWQDSFKGDLPIPFYGFLSMYYPGIAGFTGLHLYNLKEDMNYFLGTSLWVKFTTELPE